jgi:predicted Zn-dependent protease
LALGFFLPASSWSQPSQPNAPDSDNGSFIQSSKTTEADSAKFKVKLGSIDDVNSVGHRKVGGRGWGNWYSTDTEVKMGKMYATEIEKSGVFVTDPVVTNYINRIGQKIVDNSDCDTTFTFRVIDADEINAFALPGAYLFINAGLILSADNEAQLAGVMAHEIAHLCAHHPARAMTHMNMAQFGALPLFMIGGWTGFAAVGVPVAFLQFSREFEAQADYLGVQYLYRAGYDPQAYIAFFKKVQALQNSKQGCVATAFGQHPQTVDRILRTQQEIARILPPREEYAVTTSEFDEVKARMVRYDESRRMTESDNGRRPSLRKTGSALGAPTNPVGNQFERGPANGVQQQ